MERKTIKIILGGIACAISVFIFFNSRTTEQESRDIASTQAPDTPSPPPSASSPKKSLSLRTPSQISDKKNKENSVDEFEKNFTKKYSTGWTFQRTKRGKIFRIMGGEIKGLNDKPKAIEGLSRNLASFANITGQSFNYQSNKETKLSKTHFVSQYYKGFEVYDGWVQATSNKKGEVFIIENFIKDVDKNLSTEIRISQQQALQITATQYPQGSEIKEISTSPKIWADSSEHELVWEFSVFVRGKDLATYKVVIGAKSGRVLEQFKTSKN